MRTYWRLCAAICFRPMDLTIALIEAWRGVGSQVRSDLARYAMLCHEAALDATISMCAAPEAKP